jgi:protein-disulfide isomerase
VSGKQARRRRKQAAPPPVRGARNRRRASPKVLAAVGGGIVMIVAAVVIAVAVGGTSSAPSSTTSVPDRGSLRNALPGAAEVAREFAGIPQKATILGERTAPVTMIQYVDLQCPFCREFETSVMPSIVHKFVRTGKLRVEVRPIAFIGPDSISGRDAALAAGRQNRLFNFMQVVYSNQGTENTGWLDDGFIRRAAASVPGIDVPRLVRDARSGAVKDQAHALDRQSTQDKVKATPTLLVGKTGAKPAAVSSADMAAVSAAIERALR